MNARKYGSIVMCFAFLGGCSHAKDEARGLVGAVDGYRRADGEAKAIAAARLAAVTCSDHDVCEAKDACVAVSRPTIEGEKLKADIEKRFEEIKAGTLDLDAGVAKDLPRQLDEASRLLKAGNDALVPCDVKVTALRMRYSL